MGRRPQIRNKEGKMVTAGPRGPVTDRKSRLVQYRDQYGNMVTVDIANPNVGRKVEKREKIGLPKRRLPTPRQKMGP